MSEVEPPRRSMLYLAGPYAEMLAAYPQFPADMFCFDLEDGTPPHDKPAARERIAQTLRDLPDPAKRERLLRINGLDTPWGYDDLVAAARLPISGVLLPKVEGAAMVRQAEAVLTAAGAPDNIAIWCLIETPLGVLRAEEIATASPRVKGFVIGGGDLAETLRIPQTASRTGALHALSQCVLVARAHGLAIIDAVHPNYANIDGFAESCQQGVELGFDGKSVVLPATIPLANTAFGPDEQAVLDARELLKSPAQAVGTGYANLHLLHARRLVARADQITRLEALRSGA